MVRLLTCLCLLLSILVAIIVFAQRFTIQLTIKPVEPTVEHLQAYQQAAPTKG